LVTQAVRQRACPMGRPPVGWPSTPQSRCEDRRHTRVVASVAGVRPVLLDHSLGCGRIGLYRGMDCARAGNGAYRRCLGHSDTGQRHLCVLAGIQRGTNPRPVRSLAAASQPLAGGVCGPLGCRPGGIRRYRVTRGVAEMACAAANAAGAGSPPTSGGMVLTMLIRLAPKVTRCLVPAFSGAG
jgi:hypothetical protein